MTTAFLSDLQLELSKELPGNSAHMEMISYSRSSAEVIRKLQVTPKESAVLIMLYKENNEWFFPLIKRNEYNGVHSKQIGLPGGKFEKEDGNLEQTSIRETKEELGVDPRSIKIVGSLTEVYIPPSNFLVKPYIGILSDFKGFVPDQIEVNRVLTSSLNSLLRLPIKKTERYVKDGEFSAQVSSYIIDNEVVWGATGMILNEFKTIIKNLINKS
jgi:8-oxo-dGTP pyrophosphatase MutT (NUDIX family)